MPKINVYLPDDLADAVRDAGLPVSAICQRALESALHRLTAVREAALGEIDPSAFGTRLAGFTARLVTVVTIAVERARTAGAATVTTGDLLAGLLTEQGNLALQILTALDVAPGTLTAPDTTEPGPTGDGLRFSAPVAAVLEQAVGEANGLGHHYVGTEHLLIALVTEPAGAAGELLRSRGVDARSARQATAAALAGYVHLRTALGTGSVNGLRAALQTELVPLIKRIERLEARAS